MENIQIKVLQHESAKGLPLPKYATKDSAGMDLSANVQEPITLAKGERKLIPTGVSIALPPGYEAQIRPRSGLAIKHGITVLNTPGTIDADYRGEVMVILINLSDQDFIIERGLRIAQIIVSRVMRTTMVQVEILDETDRNSGGFGSTGR
jgi:dUTP pyrophosphatase